MLTIRSEEQKSAQLPKLCSDPDLPQPFKFRNPCGDIERTSSSGKCKKDTIKSCSCGSPEHKVWNCTHRSRSMDIFAFLLIPLVKVGPTKDFFPPTFTEHKMEVFSPLCSDDEEEVSMEELFTRPSSTAIEVAQPLGPDSMYINPASLALCGRQLLDLLCKELHVASKDCFPSAPSFETIIAELPVETQNVSLGTKLAVNTKFLGSEKFEQRQIDHFFCPPDEVKAHPPELPLGPTLPWLSLFWTMLQL
jgi:hypothetical protein